MNIHQLLHQRDALLQQARLANVAFAYQRLRLFADRIARAHLRGAVALRAGDLTAARPWPWLAALEGSQAVLEEHFLDEEIVELTDILTFLGEDAAGEGLTLRLEDLAARFLPQLQRELASAGVKLADLGRPGLVSTAEPENPDLP